MGQARTCQQFAMIAGFSLISNIVLAVTANADNWPQFRGSTGQGLSGEVGLPITWGGDDREHLCWQSPLIGEAHIFFANAGKSFVIQAGRDYKLLATNELGDPNHCSPAVSGGNIFLVGTKNIYCIGSGPPPGRGTGL
jgi:hypothetical protein